MDIWEKLYIKAKEVQNDREVVIRQIILVKFLKKKAN